MSENNIENFDLITAHVLGALYQSFPLEIELSSTSIAHELKLTNSDTLDHEYAIELIDASINWLKRAGFIWLDGNPGMRNGGFACDATLTPKSLSILKSTPQSLQQKKTLGDQMKDVGAGAVKGVPSQLVSLLVNGATGNVPALIATLMKILAQDNEDSSIYSTTV